VIRPSLVFGFVYVVLLFAYLLLFEPQMFDRFWFALARTFIFALIAIIVAAFYDAIRGKRD